VYKTRIIRGLVVMGCSFLLTASAWGQFTSLSQENMNDGDGGSDYDISNIFFGYGSQMTVAPVFLWGAQITFNAGAGTTGVSLSGDNVTVLYSHDLFNNTNIPTTGGLPNTAGADAFSTCNVIGTVVFAQGANNITCQFDNQNFMQPIGGTGFDPNTGYYAVLDLGGSGVLKTGFPSQGTLTLLTSAPTTSSVPEPGTVGAGLLGLTGLMIARRRMSGAKQQL